MPPARGTLCSPSLRAFFEQIAGDDKDRRKIALIASAHHLTRVMLAMLKGNTPWQERLAEGPPAPEHEHELEPRDASAED